MPSLAERLTDPVRLLLGGKEWPLIFTYGVLLDCQEATGIDMLTGVEAFVGTSAKVLRALLLATLRRTDPSLTRDAVGALITPRRLPAIRSSISAALLASMPEPLPKKAEPTAGVKHIKIPQKPMGWMQTAALARIELGLSESEFLGCTPRYLHALREVSVERMRREELLTGFICEVIVNFSKTKLKKPAKASDWVMHKSTTDEYDEPLDIGEKMLRELQKLEYRSA